MHYYIAVDMGAESGRVVRGGLADGRLSIDGVSRFTNGMVRMGDRLCWDTDRLMREIGVGVRKMTAGDGDLVSIGVDSWGIDFALLDADGLVLGKPVAYRDARTEGMMEEFFGRMSAEEVYGKTGIQFLGFNTLYQLFAMVRHGAEELREATDLLMIPDLFNYMMTGRKTTEFTNATTTQLLNIHDGVWDCELFEALGVSVDIMQEIIGPGTVVGGLNGRMMSEFGCGDVAVVAPATHDTGSAVAAVPADRGGFAYISSGTWSLMGIETRVPVTSDAAREYNFTNEGGVNGTVRVLRNIMGLWLVQRCRVEFGEEYDYDRLTRLAEEAEGFVSVIDVDDMRLLNPKSMPVVIRELCVETNQACPKLPGEFVRCALVSLALEYRMTLEALNGIWSESIDRIHIVGGGTRNELLCQFTANATGLPVIAGPIEASAIGNLLLQARAMGHIGTLEDAREVVRLSFELREYEPRDTSRWDDTFERYKKIKDRK